jgi:hypothetical protein
LAPRRRTAHVTAFTGTARSAVSDVAAPLGLVLRAKDSARRSGPNGLLDDLVAAGIPDANPAPTSREARIQAGFDQRARGSRRGRVLPVMGTGSRREKVGCNPLTQPGGCPVKLALDTTSMTRPPGARIHRAASAADFNICGGPPAFPLRFRPCLDGDRVRRRAPHRYHSRAPPADPGRPDSVGHRGTPARSLQQPVDALDTCDVRSVQRRRTAPADRRWPQHQRRNTNLPGLVFDADPAFLPSEGSRSTRTSSPAGARYGGNGKINGLADCARGSGTRRRLYPDADNGGDPVPARTSAGDGLRPEPRRPLTAGSPNPDLQRPRLPRTPGHNRLLGTDGDRGPTARCSTLGAPAA